MGLDAHSDGDPASRSFSALGGSRAKSHGETGSLTPGQNRARKFHRRLGRWRTARKSLVQHQIRRTIPSRVYSNLRLPQHTTFRCRRRSRKSRGAMREHHGMEPKTIRSGQKASITHCLRLPAVPRRGLFPNFSRTFRIRLSSKRSLSWWKSLPLRELAFVWMIMI